MRVHEVRTLQMRATEVRTLQMRLVEHRTLQMRAHEELRTLQPRTFEVYLLCALRRCRLEVDRVAVEILALIEHEVNVLAAIRVLHLRRRRQRARSL